jgi:hypothetical protein
VKSGDSDHFVSTVQYLVKAHGYRLEVDGIFGSKTAEAVRAFQRSRGLTEDAIVGPHTWAALIIRVRKGSRGDAVRAVQQELQYRNTLDNAETSLQIDGIFGSETDVAVRRFQEAIVLDQDGIVGPITWQALAAGMLRWLPQHDPLQLNAVCTETTTTTLRWKVSNPNPFAADFDWHISDTQETGHGIAPAKGDAYFTSNRIDNSNIAQLFVDNQPVITAASCLPLPSPPDPSEPTVARANVESVAKLIYDMVGTGQDLQGALSELFGVFGIPTLRAVEDADKVSAAVEAKEPMVLDVQLDALNAEFKSGLGIGLESAFDQFPDLGADVFYAPFTDDLSSIANKDEFTVDEALAALIVELGRERARRAKPANVNPVWGDAQLDPLQFALLFYIVAFAPMDQAEGQPAGPGPSITQPPSAGGRLSATALFTPGAIKTALRNIAGKALKAILKKLVKWLGLPEAAWEGTKLAVCASILLGYRMTLKASDTLLYRRWPENPSLHPWKANYQLSAVYEAPTRGEIVLKQMGCGADKRPPAGKVANKPVSWAIEDNRGQDDSARNHGYLAPDPGGEKTDSNGQATATFTAFDEETPPEDRTPETQHAAHGVVVARVTNLLPGLDKIEAIQRFINIPPAGTKPLDVIYYAQRRYRLTVEQSFIDGAVDVKVRVLYRQQRSEQGIITISSKAEGDETIEVHGRLYGVATGGTSGGGCLNAETWQTVGEYPVDIWGSTSQFPEGEYVELYWSMEQDPPTIVHSCSGGTYYSTFKPSYAWGLGRRRLPDSDHPITRSEERGPAGTYLILTLELLDNAQHP